MVNGSVVEREAGVAGAVSALFALKAAVLKLVPRVPDTGVFWRKTHQNA